MRTVSQLKRVGDYTLQGSVQVLADNHAVKRVFLNNGRFDDGYRVLGWRILGNSVYSGTAGDCVAVLSTISQEGEVATTNPFDLDDSTQIGWGWSNLNAETGVEANDAFVNRENFIVEDLWINVRMRNTTGRVNYLIDLEKVQANNDIGVLAMIRNNSQDVPGNE